MQPDAPALLWDARRAVLIQDFIAGDSLDQYERDAMLRSAVERQFEVIGEALNKLKRADPETAAGIADLPKIVAFRNIWRMATPRSTTCLSAVPNPSLVELCDVLDRLLAESPDSG